MARRAELCSIEGETDMRVYIYMCQIDPILSSPPPFFLWWLFAMAKRSASEWKLSPCAKTFSPNGETSFFFSPFLHLSLVCLFLSLLLSPTRSVWLSVSLSPFLFRIHETASERPHFRRPCADDEPPPSRTGWAAWPRSSLLRLRVLSQFRCTNRWRTCFSSQNSRCLKLFLYYFTKIIKKLLNSQIFKTLHTKVFKCLEFQILRVS